MRLQLQLKKQKYLLSKFLMESQLNKKQKIEINSLFQDQILNATAIRVTVQL